MRARLRYAIIPTRNRPHAYAACVAALAPQVDDFITVCHGRTAVSYAAGLPMLYEPEAPNISAMWNLGLDCLSEAFPREAYDVAIVNDDAVVPPHWFDHLSYMTTVSAAAACVDQHHRLDVPALHLEPGPVDLRVRLTGFAFILDGTKGIRADEDMRWWYSDDALDWTARTMGGTLVLPGEPVQHPEGGGTPIVGELADFAAEDRQRFIEKWGQAPW